jgi:hypothetical protein
VRFSAGKLEIDPSVHSKMLDEQVAQPLWRGQGALEDLTGFFFHRHSMTNSSDLKTLVGFIVELPDA